MPKPLKPTLRERNRYLVFEVTSDHDFDRKDVVDSIWETLLRLYGEVGAGKTSLWVMDWEKERKRGILKVNHGSVNTLKTSTAVVGVIKGRKAIITVLKTTGTLKKAREMLK
jgi:ribonuclease P/MRP protein subunit POP5